MIIDPHEIENKFTTFEVKDPLGNRIGFMLKCNMCGIQEHFMASDKPKTRENKIVRYLKAHDHTIVLAN